MTTVSHNSTAGSRSPYAKATVGLSTSNGRSVVRLILLAGATRQPQMRRATGRIPAMLPLADDLTVFEHWLNQTEQLADRYDVDRFDVRLLVDDKAPPFELDCDRPRLAVTVQRDPDQYRGTGGLLRDIAEELDDSDWLFVVNAGQILLQPLDDVFDRLDGTAGDVVVATNEDGSPSGFTLIRAGVLRSIKPVGFVDLKEQALPEIAKRHRVAVATFVEAPAMMIRERPHYLAALRRLHRTQAGLPDSEPFEERWSPAFRVVEPGATVAPDAIVQDSVLLGNARIESGAVVVRSVICAGAVVRRKQRIIERIIGAAE